MSPDTPVVDVKRLSLTLGSGSGNVNILHDLDLKINPCETVAVMGPSGSGKTSLIMLIAGLEAPSAGQILIKGEDITHKNEDALARFRAQHIGVVFQSFHLIPTMTALENVAIPLEFTNIPHPRDKAQETLEKLGLKDRIHHYPSQLSGGEQQRVAIARAFVTRPTLLLADEPTGNLDKETGEQVIRLLLDLNKTHGSTLMLITHDPDVARHCNRTIRIEDGRLV